MGRSKASERDKQIGNAIRDMRDLAGLNQTQLAEALDMKHQQISKYERGVSQISINLWEKIVEVLTAINPAIEGFAEQQVAYLPPPGLSKGERKRKIEAEIEQVLDRIKRILDEA